MEMETEDDIPEDGINLSIINEMKMRRHLWDSRHPLYKDSETKRRSWSEVARKLGIEEPFLKTRWRSLRDRYMKERRREVQYKKTGGSRKTRPWTMMKNLEFLRKAKQRGCPSPDAQDLEGQKEMGEGNPLQSDQEQPGGVQTAAPGVSTYLIIKPDNTIQCLPGVKMPSPKSRPLRRIEPATSESPRNVTITIPPSSSIAGSSGMTAQPPAIKNIPRLTPMPITLNRMPEVPHSPEAESSERYFYLSIAKEMESRSTRVRLKMRKLISDELLKLYEEEESHKEQPKN